MSRNTGQQKRPASGDIWTTEHRSADTTASEHTSGDHATSEQLSNDEINTIVKRRHGMLPNESGNIDAKPGDNARYVRFAMASWDLPPIDISNPDQVRQRISDYFHFCADNDRKPQLVGMSNWLGVSRDTLNSWKRGEYRSATHSDIVQKAVAALEEMWSDYMMNGKVNPASGIFIGKNWFGYRDVQDVVVTPNNPLDSADADEIRKRYTQALPDADE